MTATTTDRNVSSVSYATKSNAKRALKKICTGCLRHASEIVIEIDGRFHFDEDLVEKYMTTAEWHEVYGHNGSGLPDETIKPSDEAEVAAALDKEEAAQEVQPTSNQASPTSVTRETQKTSLKLDRRISVVGSGEIFKNACAMWKAHPDWMTSAQEDRLTRELYAAAKRGEKIAVEINGRSFELVNV